MKYTKYTREAVHKRYFAYALALVLIGGSLAVSAVQNGGHPAHAAGSDTLYLSPASGSHTVGSTFTVQVRENSNTDSVNAVEADLTYASSKLQFVSTSLSGTAFGVTASNTGGGGSISIDLGSTTAVTGDKLIGTITFKALASGSGTATFTSSSSVLSATTNANVVSSMTGGAYTLAAAASGSKPPASGGSTSTKKTSPPKTTPAPSSSATTSTTSIAPKGNPTPVTVPNNSQVEVNDQATVQTTPATNKPVAKVQYYLNGKLVATVTQAPYTYSVDTDILRNGTYTLEAKTQYNDGTVDTKTTSLLVKNPFGWTQFVLQVRHYAWLIIILAIIIVDGVWTFARWYRKRQLLNRHINTPMSGGPTHPPDSNSQIHVGIM